jgi:hypothetical protein
MIQQSLRKFPRLLLSALALILAFAVRPACAGEPGDPKTAAAVAAMETWLREIDQHQYAQSWADASAFFQKSASSAKWVSMLDVARAPLGACTSRKLASAMRQTEVPGPAGMIKGDFVIAQFNTSFQNLAYAIETVTFEKGSDGAWKADGYYIRPR